jgi:hypothetical protein
MGRAFILSKGSITVPIIYTEKFISYVIPNERIGLFHSVEVGKGTTTVKFFPRLEVSNVFRICSGGTVEFL